MTRILLLLLAMLGISTPPRAEITCNGYATRDGGCLLGDDAVEAMRRDGRYVRPERRNPMRASADKCGRMLVHDALHATEGAPVRLPLGCLSVRIPEPFTLKLAADGHVTELWSPRRMLMKFNAPPPAPRVAQVPARAAAPKPSMGDGTRRRIEGGALIVEMR